MPGGSVEAIKERLNIVDVLRGYLTLQPAGKNFRALCPFHREKTPSFMVSPDRQSWHCFGCALGGDIFSFVMRYENVEFSEALKILAEKAGIELQRVSTADYKFFGLLYELNDAAKEFFKRELGASKEALAYLNERGMKKETIDEFDLGWAPQSPEVLNLHLLNLGYAPADIVRAGLALKTERGAQLDRFRGRIMFPIHNHFGKTVGFTGRVLPKFDDGTMGKYVNSPESPIFNKSKLLYGFWRTKNAIRETGSAFLVEGQMDFLMSYQAGVKNVVASSGTALTPDHLRVLGRLTEELVISFDSDEAGFAAGERAIDLAQANDFNVKVVLLRDFKDPAEAAQAGAEHLTTALKEAKAAPEFYFARYIPKKLTGPVTREELKGVRAVLRKLKQISSPVERTSWVKELARRTGLDQKVLSEEMNRLEVRAIEHISDHAIEEAPEKKISRRELVSQHLLAAALALGELGEVADVSSYLPDPHRRAYELLLQGKHSDPEQPLDELLNLVVLQATEQSADVLRELKRRLSDEYAKERRKELSQKIKFAEANGNDAELEFAMEELKRLSAHNS